MEFQVQILLTEIESDDHLGPADQVLFQKMVRNAMPTDETATDTLITQRLVTFRNIAQLQEQNESLLRITRELGKKMEEEERKRKESEDAQHRDQLQIVASNVESLKQEITSLQAK